MIPNASLIASHRNALRSRILRGQLDLAQFVLRCCSIISIMLSRAGRGSAAAATKGDQQQQQEAQQQQVLQQQHSYHRYSYSHSKKPKHLENIGLFQTPPIEKKITSDVRHVAYMLYITHYLSISHVPFLPLCVDNRPIKSSLSFFCHAVTT